MARPLPLTAHETTFPFLCAFTASETTFPFLCAFHVRCVSSIPISNSTRNAAGGTLLDAICGNPAATPRWLELASGGVADEMVNDRHSPRNLKWKVIFQSMRVMAHLGISRSHLTMDLAHVEDSTPVHLAAQQGNYKLVQWLLRNGAASSLHTKNRMGCKPIDVARVFGPDHEIGGLLGAAMCNDALSESQSPTHRRPSNELAIQVARSSQTAITMEYDMWCIPVAELLKLSELRPHQELRAAGKLVRWNASMRAVFFLSHQWTSFTRPDHSTAQLRTVQRMLARMLQGTLPETAPSFTDRIRFASKVKVSSREWEALVPHAFVWLDFISVPQVNTSYTELSADETGRVSDLMKAVNSIPAYVEKCSHFFAITPSISTMTIDHALNGIYLYNCKCHDHRSPRAS